MRTPYTVIWCLFHFCLYDAWQIKLMWISVILAHGIKKYNTVCLSCLNFVPLLILNLWWSANWLHNCSRRNCPELTHCPVVKDQWDFVLNVLKELEDKEFLFLMGQNNTGIFSCCAACHFKKQVQFLWTRNKQRSASYCWLHPWPTNSSHENFIPQRPTGNLFAKQYFPFFWVELFWVAHFVHELSNFLDELQCNESWEIFSNQLNCSPRSSYQNVKQNLRTHGPLHARDWWLLHHQSKINVSMKSLPSELYSLQKSHLIVRLSIFQIRQTSVSLRSSVFLMECKFPK